MLFEHFCGISGAALILKQHEYLPIVQFDSLMAAKSALMDHVPVQYIIGTAWFADLSFEVNPWVLIPRPETEELLGLILAGAKHYPLNAEPRLLDIGTGSGCIAVALKKSLPGWQVDACDISEDALGVAGRNADKAGTAINFFKADILRWKEWKDAGSYQIIVSNPPYVCEREKKEMQPNVLEHEPGLALFVPDDDPLMFYKTIAGFAAGHLVRNGRLYLEMNECYGPELSYLLTLYGFKDVEVRKDIRGKDRFAVAVKEF
jgi:release factor glutamine methyltransferase